MFKILLASRPWIMVLVLGILWLSCDSTEPEVLPDQCLSSVFEGDIILNSQAAVDEFGKSCYTSIDGTLQIGTIGKESDIRNLAGLRHITRVGNLHVLSNPRLTSLSGMASLSQVDERIYIRNNASLKNISALEGISNEHLSVTILGNSVLYSLRGLGSIEKFNNLDIVDNPGLLDLKALNYARTINCLYIEANESLTSLDGLENVNKLNCLFIRSNRLLVDYCALSEYFSNDPGQMEFECSQNGFDVSLSELGSGECSYQGT